jgi:hypothetical protein
MWNGSLRSKFSVMVLGGGLLLSAACVPVVTPPGSGGSTSPTVVPPTTTAGVAGKPVAPSNGVLFGLWENPGEGNHTTEAEHALWLWRETFLGRKADIGHQFYPFGTTWPTQRETWHIQNGRTPMISWNGTTASDINAGKHDALIRTRAKALKALNSPVFLRYFWEPDAAAKRAMAVSPAAYIAQWKRVRSIFASEGATNAAFVWCPTAYAFKNGDAPKYYPGDGQVDWICADGYNWGQTQGGDKWRDWTTIYQSFYDFGTAHDKPMIAGEYGSVERRSGEKAQWFRTMRAQVKYMPRIKAIVYFDSLRQDDGVWRDWRVDTSADSYKAFRELARDPYFNTRNR